MTRPGGILASKVFRELVLAFSRNPSLVERARRTLETTPREQAPWGQVLVDALARASGAPARENLLRLIENVEAPLALRERAAIDIAISKHGEADPATQLLSIARRTKEFDPIAGSLPDALGLAAQRARERGEIRTAREVKGWLLERLRSTGAGERCSALRGLGNLGDPETVDPIVDMARAPEEDSDATWSVVHAVEAMAGYEARLAGEVARRPSLPTLMMVNSILNTGRSEAAGRDLFALLAGVAADPGAPSTVRQEARGFLQHQKGQGRYPGVIPEV